MISYAKGNAALRQLVTWLGDETFLAGLNAYLTRHRLGNATLADFLAALDEVSERDVRGLGRAVAAHHRLRHDPGHPRRRGAGADPRGEPAAPHPGDGVRRRAWPRSAAASSTWPTSRSARRVGGAGRRTQQPRGDLRAAGARRRSPGGRWSGGLSRIDDAMVRAVLWTAAFGLVRSRELSADDYLALVARHLPAEPEVTIVSAVVGRTLGHGACRSGCRRRRPARALDLLADGLPRRDRAEPTTSRCGSSSPAAWPGRAATPARCAAGWPRVAPTTGVGAGPRPALDGDPPTGRAGRHRPRRDRRRAPGRRHHRRRARCRDRAVGRRPSAPPRRRPGAPWSRTTRSPTGCSARCARGLWSRGAGRAGGAVRRGVLRRGAAAGRGAARPSPRRCAAPSPRWRSARSSCRLFETALTGDLPTVLRRGWEDRLDDLR